MDKDIEALQLPSVERTWFSEGPGKRKGSGIVNVNGEVNCKVNELATESAEAQILKG